MVDCMDDICNGQGYCMHPLTYQDGWDDLWADRSYRGEDPFPGMEEPSDYLRGFREAGVFMDHTTEAHDGGECDC